MKIRCRSCGKRFSYEEQDGICPHCGAYNSVSWDVEPGGGDLSPSEPTVCDAPEWHAEAGHYDEHGVCTCLLYTSARWPCFPPLRGN